MGRENRLRHAVQFLFHVKHKAGCRDFDKVFESEEKGKKKGQTKACPLSIELCRPLDCASECPSQGKGF